MAVDASIVNGDITNSAYKTAEQRKAEENTANNDLDKQAFLKLLVAQMKYQDPMEPTDNTEYVSQLAQFSSLDSPAVSRPFPGTCSFQKASSPNRRITASRAGPPASRAASVP